MISTPTDDELLALVARHWSIGPARLTGPQRGTNNLTRIVTTDRAVGVLRVYRNLDQERVAREHRLLARLASAGLPYRIPRPVPTGSGATLVASPWGAISLSDWIDGRRPDLERPGAARAAGRALARLDLALAAVPEPDAPFDWLGPDIGRATIDPGLVTALADAGLPGAQVAWLRQRTGPPARPAELPVQIIHCDFGASNLLVTDDDQLSGVLDFEVAGRDLRINDLAITLFQSGLLDGPDWPARTAELLIGYAEVITPDPAEIMIIPSLIAARALGTVGWRATRWRTGLDTLAEVSDRITEAQQTEHWLTHHRSDLLALLHHHLTPSSPSSPPTCQN
ncbi:phosphotransferase enzyme family protein [Microlunatus speluncae]|uniref:phosphotransferase enzyme family protein n=1 Tax=Microlunatus speluncae TaxID=2594267 RepID=UPI0013754904|nr:phosphotransferase [Microlunatus speluncae]